MRIREFRHVPIGKGAIKHVMYVDTFETHNDLDLLRSCVARSPFANTAHVDGHMWLDMRLYIVLDEWEQRVFTEALWTDSPQARAMLDELRRYPERWEYDVEHTRRQFERNAQSLNDTTPEPNVCPCCGKEMSDV